MRPIDVMVYASWPTIGTQDALRARRQVGKEPVSFGLTTRYHFGMTRPAIFVTRAIERQADETG